MSSTSDRRIRREDARELYLLISECVERGGDGLVWRRHLVQRLPEWLDVDMTFFADHQIVGSPGDPGGWLRPLSIIDHWPSEAHRRFFWEEFVRDGRHEHTPMAYLIKGHSGVRVSSRRDVIPTDEAYYESYFFRRYLVPSGLDDFIHSVSCTPDGGVQMLNIQRKAGRPSLPRRYVHLIRALWVELRRLQPDTLRPVSESALMLLPKRMLEVLSCLMQGRTVKQTAELLGISEHTVHEHTKRLYKRSGASNRAELIARYYDLGPLLQEMPADDLCEHLERLKHATQAPWPRQPGVLLPEMPVTDCRFDLGL
ncbi:DNA-binding transcriptional activator UhpA [Planctomycetes bacterium MalM25]|nr:DNA-binding transcriptional activator UhpA [Planctomycetes bacterium MalM25]